MSGTARGAIGAASTIAAARRIYVVGPPASGKTSLARRLGEVRGIPVHDLDLVHREAGGNTPPRSEAERRAMVEAILATDSWVAEGVHLGWTDGLMAEAELVIWLDHLGWPRLAARMTRRFAGGATSQARHERGRRRFLRLADYRRHVGELLGTLRDARAYATTPGFGPRGTPGRRATLEQLSRHRERLIVCRRQADVDELVRLASAGLPTKEPAGRGREARSSG
jgi:adenylate kinase family enzyme